jgi:hypothetical protein
VLCKVCLASRGAYRRQATALAPILVTPDLRCFDTADAMSGCNKTAPAHLIEARRPEVKQLSGHRCEGLCRIELLATEMTGITAAAARIYSARRSRLSYHRGPDRDHTAVRLWAKTTFN